MLKRINKRQIVALLITLCFGLTLVLVNKVERTDLYSTQGRNFEKAQVLEILADNVGESGNRIGQQTVLLLMMTGAHRGETLEANSSSSYLYGAQCTPGMKVIATVNESAEELYVTVYSFDRSMILYMIIALFLVTLWIVGGKQGINAAIALIFTFVSIVGLFIPLVYRGISPIGTTVVIAIMTTVVTMYLIGGAPTKVWSAIISTSIGIILSGVLAWAFGLVAGISGYNVSDIEQLEYVGQMTDIRIGELLYSGILISALGAIMDVAMSVSSSVHEIAFHAPEMDWRKLYTAGLHVGRDMMSTMSNTLILAFTGSSINTLIFIYAYQYNSRQIINMYSIGIEIIQGVSATMGVILTVPIAAFISARMLKKSM